MINDKRQHVSERIWPVLRQVRAACRVRWASLSFVIFFLTCAPAAAQFNTERLITIGRSALYFEDYVLSIQYFNQAISAKPYLYEPWFFRAVAKYYLDDYSGAERDCTEAIQRNPYVVSLYELRGLCRIQQKKYGEAAADYTVALRYDPVNRNLWHNRAFCRLKAQDYDAALAELDTVVTRWSRHAPAYAMKADVYMQQHDTAQAVAALEKSLEIDPYDGQTWAARSIISLSREEWSDAEHYLDKAIHLLPKNGGCYINRALARYNQDNLRGAMADYDTALELEPGNFLGHYNRGLLRSQVGDDNRAITDFDFVLEQEPDNLLALYNRAVLLDKTGDLRGAIRDYSKVIDEYPNFWTGLEARASCYRRLGQNRKAEADENTVYRARLMKHFFGTQPKMGKKPLRKRSDEDMEKYNQLVVADEQELEHNYQNEYRGKVQHRKVEAGLLPMYGLSLEPMRSEVKSYVAFDRDVDELNQRLRARTIYINNSHTTLSDSQSSAYFSLLDSLSHCIAESQHTDEAVSLLLLRSLAYTAIQNFESAIEDLSTYLQVDSLSVPALWQRAVCQSKINQFQASEGTNTDLKTANVLADLNHALQLAPQNAFLLYDRANVFAQRKDYERAIADYTSAIGQDARLAEAWFNRGLCRIYSNDVGEGINDLSKAGELGLYQAYSIIKKHRKQQ
ncbi:MAG: tetratricopeptide repeat protein [Prevotella sp.]|nr:tetratricopeptide repeat protein [Prevotella sp.]